MHGNDWAHGFMCGMHMRHDGWAELVNDEQHGGCLIPMMMLCHEHDEDPEMRPEPISTEQREDVIVHMAAGLLGTYRYFRAQRETYANTTFKHEPRRTAANIGRNDPCPCGSGKKYKRCCGGAAVNSTASMEYAARSFPRQIRHRDALELGRSAPHALLHIICAAQRVKAVSSRFGAGETAPQPPKTAAQTAAQLLPRTP